MREGEPLQPLIMLVNRNPAVSVRRCRPAPGPAPRLRVSSTFTELVCVGLLAPRSPPFGGGGHSCSVSLLRVLERYVGTSDESPERQE